MGCCVSSTKKSTSPNSNRAPPQSLLQIEEETVEKVIPHIPANKPKIQSSSSNDSSIPEEKSIIVDKKSANVNSSDVAKSPETGKNVKQRISPSARFIDDGDVRRRLEGSPSRNRSRSFSSDLKGQRDIGKSAARISESGPVRVTSTLGRERRGDAGERSARRTISSARYTSGESNRCDLGRSSSMRSGGKYSGRVRTENNRKIGGSKRAPTLKETLENPLVSLECFIFL